MMRLIHGLAHFPVACAVGHWLLLLVNPQNHIEWLMWILMVTGVTFAALRAVETTLSLFKNKENKE